MKNLFGKCPVVLQTGFRIFFLGAAVHAIVTMIFWLIFYVASGNIFVALPLTVWHGHEMIFGFAMAVVAGFLLTAVTNWTGRPTLSGAPLLLLFLLWLLARIMAFLPKPFPLWILGLCNLTFVFFLTVALLRPIIAVKQWNQSAVFSKLILIFISGGCLYGLLGTADLLTQRQALRFAVYMLISLIFTIGRRVLPFFIERGVGYPVIFRNSRWCDRMSLVFLLAFSILDVFWPQPYVIAGLCLGLTGTHVIRLSGWYTVGIWRKPLLWILFVGYGFLILGFVLKFLTVIRHRPDDLALHAWTTGGIGIFILGMMARVAWGHTGRNVAEPPKAILAMFLLIVASAVLRVLVPLCLETLYLFGIGVSQILWVLAFGMYLAIYWPALTSARVDGKWG